jgi:hypothetical protein
MLIVTEKAAYFLEDNGRQKEPFHIYEGSAIAHVEEGSHLLVIARTNGNIVARAS